MKYDYIFAVSDLNEVTFVKILMLVLIKDGFLHEVEGEIGKWCDGNWGENELFVISGKCCFIQIERNITGKAILRLPETNSMI